MTIGRKIKERRKELGLSQRELAARLGYTDHTTLTRIEGGKVDLPQSRIVKIAEVLGVSPAYLMGWDKGPEELGALAAQAITDPGALKVLSGYMELGAEDRATVQALVASLAAKTKKA